MYKIILADGTQIENFAVGTTSDNLIHIGSTYAEAASFLDEITPENTVAIRVYDGDTEIAFGGNLILNEGAVLADAGEYKTCTVTLRHKTEIEIMHDEISELQDVVLEG